MIRNTTLYTMVLAVLGSASARAQVLLHEEFTGGASTTGFTVQSTASDCDWVYAPGALVENSFNQDYSDTIPFGPGFDTDFAFIDSDECTGTISNTVNTNLVSPAFDASGAAELHLVFSHQFRDFTGSVATVEVFNGSAWTSVASWEDDIGYPNPVTITDLNITTAAGGSAVAQVRFNYSATWDWWWAIDDIRIVAGSVGMAEHSSNGPLRLFPNPVSDVLNVQYTGTGVVGMEVQDASGRTVMQHPMVRTVPVDMLSSGVYTLILRDRAGKALARERFVRQ